MSKMRKIKKIHAYRTQRVILQKFDSFFGQFSGVYKSEKGQKMVLKWLKKGKKGLRKVQKYHETVKKSSEKMRKF